MKIHLTDLEINNITFYQWNKASESDIMEYTDNLEILYNDKLYESLLFSDLNCKDKSHMQELSSIYCGTFINIELAPSNLPKHNKRLYDVIIVRWNDKIIHLIKMLELHFLF